MYGSLNGWQSASSMCVSDIDGTALSSKIATAFNTWPNQSTVHSSDNVAVLEP